MSNKITPAEKLETGPVRIFQDPDGFEFIEQFFSNGSSVLMHKGQFEAITLAAARSHDMILYINNEGPMPDRLKGNN
jgi:hypothetical protein